MARWIEILSNYDCEVEFRSGNADALCRCDSPKDCKCPAMDTSETLQCGPCKTCKKRAEVMVLEEIEHKVINLVDTTVLQTEDSIEHRQENEIGKAVREINQS